MSKPSDDDKELAEIAYKHFQSGVFKLRQALFNKKVSGLLITEAEVASILLALGEFKAEEVDEEICK